MADFRTVWRRIEAHEGEEFRQKLGKPFSYEVKSGSVRLSTTNRQIPKSAFEEALRRFPWRSLTELQDLQGPSFIYGILMDPRIRASDW